MQKIGNGSAKIVRNTHSRRLMNKKDVYEDKKNSRFDSLVARYYTAVYSSAARLTDDRRQAVALTREAFYGARKQSQSIRSQTAIATVLIATVLRAGLADA